MNITKLALRRPVSCALIVLSLIVFGISAIFGFRMELTPDMEMPVLLVMTVYPGSDPESVEDLVTKVVEDAGSIMSGIESVMSQSSENYSMVMFQYEYGSDIDDCYADLRSALDTATMDLPEGCESPVVIEMNMNAAPILSVSATEVGDIDMLSVINDQIVPEFETLSCIADITVSGGAEDYIRVQVKPDELKQYGLTMSNLVSYLGTADFNYPAGSVVQGSQDISVKTSIEYNTVQLLQSLPIATSTGATITMADVADISMASEQADSVSRYNGHENISISMTKNQSYGTVNACRDIREKLEELKGEYPSIEFMVTYDSSSSITSSLLSVGQTLVVAVVLSMAVLFLFFGDFKASLIVGSSMPISLLLTFILMEAAGFSLNIVTMGAMVIAIGMMVDSSIVVIESCFRAQEEHPDIKQAALMGTQEVTASIVASTITTIVVYLPLAMMKGLSGQIFGQLGYTIVFAMMASLIMALTLVPLFYTRFRPKEKTEIPMNRLLNRFNVFYQKLLRRLLNRKILVFIGTAAMLAAAVLAATTLNVELMPSSDEGIVSVSVSFRPGTSLGAMDETMAKLERMAAEDENLSAYSMSISGSAASLSLTLAKDSSLSTNEEIERWVELTEGMTNMEIVVSSGSSGGMTSMMSAGSKEIDLQSLDRERLKADAVALQDQIRQLPGVASVTSDVQNVSTAAKVNVDPLKAMANGLTPVQVGMTLNNVLSGVKAVDIVNNGTEYEVKVEYPQGMYDNLNGLMNLDIQTPMGTYVPLRDIARIEYTDEMESIIRSDGQYQVAINATLTPSQRFEAEAAIDELAASFSYSEGVRQAGSMMTEMMVEELSAILYSIFVAVFLVFLVMAMQFESPKFSFMVMICIPFSLIGSFLMLAASKVTLSMVSMMGFLMLMGIVVNNGILFVDSTNLYRQTMPLEDALIKAGTTRIRPILMTSLTTVLSMIPMGLGLGDNGQIMQGMAVVIVGGLVASTVLTLLLLPTFYLILDGVGRKRREKKKIGEESQNP